MKQGMTLADMVDLVDYQHDNHRDFIVSTKDMKVSLSYLAPFLRPFTFSFIRKETTRGIKRLHEFEMSDHMLRQVSQHTGVSMSLIEAMQKGTDKEWRELGQLLTVRLRENPAQRMIRTYLPSSQKPILTARAFLSDRFRVLDNYDLLQAIYPIIKELKGTLVIESCAITETHFYFKLRYPLIRGKLGTIKQNGAEVDDIVEAGVIITNSEVGEGSIRVQPFLNRLVCKNGATVTVMQSGKMKAHIGRKLAQTDDPQVQTNEQIFADFAQVVKKVVTDRKFFKQVTAQFRATKTQYITNSVAAIRVLAQQFKLSEWESQRIDYFLNSGRGIKKSRFDLINAITRLAHAKSDKLTYTRATELERIGGRLIEMSDITWKSIGSTKPLPKELYED